MGRDARHDYPFIRRWGEMLGSAAWYIADEVERARRDKAPPTATYKRSGEAMAEHGRLWATIEDVTNPGTRHYFTSRGWMRPDWTLPEDA